MFACLYVCMMVMVETGGVTQVLLCWATLLSRVLCFSNPEYRWWEDMTSDSTSQLELCLVLWLFSQSWTPSCSLMPYFQAEFLALQLTLCPLSSFHLAHKQPVSTCVSLEAVSLLPPLHNQGYSFNPCFVHKLTPILLQQT